MTADRIRSHAVVLAAAIWIVAVVTLATPGLFDRNGLLKGTDFLQFHAAAYLVTKGMGDRLYDWQLFASILQRLAPGIGDLLYVSVYPPQLAILLAPLGRLPYLNALALWSLVSACCYLLCARAVWRHCHALRHSGLSWPLLAVAFVPFHQLILHGQVSALVLACLSGSWYAVSRGRWFWAGFFVGSLAFKPPFLVAAALMMIASRDWRLLLGVSAGVLVQIAWDVAWLGTSALADYAGKLSMLLASPEMFEPKPWKMYGIRSFFELLAGRGPIAAILTALADAGVVLLVVRVWTATRSADLRVGTIVIGTVLLNPHVYTYDLVVLVLPIALLVNWVLTNPRLPQAPLVCVLAYSLYWLPLVAPLTALIRIQLVTVALAMLLWAVTEAATDEVVPAPSIVHP
jgi:hypothetical protein